MTRTATLRLRNRGIALPDMGPIASLIFLVVCFYGISGRYKIPDDSIVPRTSLPQSFTGGGKLPEANGVIISLDTPNRVSFAVTSPRLQAVSIQRVAGHYGIQLTTSQQEAASTIPYLSTSLATLPEFLSQPVYEHGKPGKNFGLLTEQQLFDCVTATRKINTMLGFHYLYTWLRIDANVKASRVAQLMDSLQARGSQSFLLSTVYKPRSDVHYRSEELDYLGPHHFKTSTSAEQ